ncbi:MAG TPA: hypothetical protein VK470_15895, partial [Bacteroidota bacterium]|nr:hypothetical protein [Bacteroidota bacterium]
MTNKILTVAKWEFIEKVKTKAFIIGLFLMPVIMGTFTVLPGLLASKSDETTKKFGLIDQTGHYEKVLNKLFAEKYKLANGMPNYALVKIEDSDTSLAHLTTLGTARLRENDIEGLLIIPSDVETRGVVELRAENVGNIRDQERLSKSLEDIITQHRLSEAGFDAKKVRSLMSSINVKTIKISEKGEEKESGFLETFVSGYIFIM